MGIKQILTRIPLKNMLIIFLGFMLFFSGNASLALFTPTYSDSKVFLEKQVMNDSFTQAYSIQEDNDFVTISFDKQSSYLMNPGKPLLPKTTKIFTYPLGTQITDVNVTIETKHVQLTKKIQPAQQPLPLHPSLRPLNTSEAIAFDADWYDQDKFFPSTPYLISKHIGLEKNKRVLFLTVTLFAQYNPSNDLLIIPKSTNVSVTYQLQTSLCSTNDSYDLLVITDERFTNELQPLVDHKNNIGMKTIMKTVQEILPQFDGRDDAEDVKLCIKQAIEEWDIKYVLLAGGRKGQSYDWFVPSRRTNNKQSQWETGYESDLYFADIYKMENDEIVFEDWDSNGNDVFAEWSLYGEYSDTIDYFPDVSVGRLPFRSVSEISPVVNKIISYETATDTSFFNKALVFGGDTFPPSRGAPMDHVYEGEEVTGVTADILENKGFSVEKLWLSLNAWTDQSDVISTINNGCGFIHFAGHGNPASWGNHPPDDTEDVFIDGLTVFSMKQLENGEELPIVMVGGCHNAQFNVTIRNVIWILKHYGIKESFFSYPFRFFYMDWIPRDFCSWLVFHPTGGAIASIGNTGLGYGSIGEIGDLDGDNITEPDCVETYGGWIESRFFDAYANQNLSVLGEIHSQAIIDYITIIGNVGVYPEAGEINEDPVGRQTIEEWALIGDPSLQIIENN